MRSEQVDRTDVDGVTILPNEILDHMVILININHTEIFHFASALIHELVHVHDFQVFAECFCNKDITLVGKHEYNKYNITWSEFNAYGLCELYACKYMDFKSHTNLTNIVIQQYMNDLKEYLINKSEIRIHTLTDISIYLGKIHTIDIYFNIDDINNSHVHEYLPLFSGSSPMTNKFYELYELFFDFSIDQDYLPVFMSGLAAFQDSIFG